MDVSDKSLIEIVQKLKEITEELQIVDDRLSLLQFKVDKLTDMKEERWILD